jgi:hypothetical protein
VRLYSYCLRYDDGAAPNPFFGVCTLVICKPAIRRAARVGDWVVGLGSSKSPVGDVSGHVVYAMRVSQKMSLPEYDAFCRSSLRGKIPNWQSKQHGRRVGDCIYDFSLPGPPRMRPGVHDERNRKTDLGGRYALLSDHYFYFGDRPRELPEHLIPIVHQTQGHKSAANRKYAGNFVSWIEGLSLKPNRLYGRPQMESEITGGEACRSACSTRAFAEDWCDAVRICS